MENVQTQQPIKRITQVKKENRESIKNQIIDLLRSTNREGIEKLITFLEESDFFTAPASVNYHANFEGGLALHCLNVYKIFKRKCEHYKMTTPPDSIIIAALCHDLCKVDFYVPMMKSKKDENGKWYNYESYGYDDKLPIGHGEKSVAVAMRYLDLTDEEICLIRWHMVFEQTDYSHSMYKALEMYPAITLLRTSDMETSAILEPTIKR